MFQQVWRVNLRQTLVPGQTLNLDPLFLPSNYAEKQACYFIEKKVIRVKLATRQPSGLTPFASDSYDFRLAQITEKDDQGNH